MSDVIVTGGGIVGMATQDIQPTRLDALAVALVKAQALIQGAVKDSSNPHFNSKYADLASVWDAIREPLTKNGLAIIQLPRRTQGGVAVETILLHASGQRISGTLEMPCDKATAQGVGSAITYARRFALAAMCGVAPVSDDDDGEAASRQPPAEVVRPAFRQPSSAFGRRLAAEQPDLIDDSRAKGSLAGSEPTPTPAEKMSSKVHEWVSEAVKAFADEASRDALISWWKSPETMRRRETAEASYPAEFSRLVGAFDARLEQLEARR